MSFLIVVVGALAVGVLALQAASATTTTTTTRPPTTTTLAPVTTTSTTQAPATTTTTQPAGSAADVVPVIECSFLDAGTGKYNTVWGYKNQTKGPKNDLPIPIGSANTFDNPAANAGQPTVFKAGTEHNAFVLTHKGSSTWTLTTYKVTAPGSACSTNPVPIVSSSSSSVWAGLATLALVTAVGMAILFWRMRRGRRV